MMIEQDNCACRFWMVWRESSPTTRYRHPTKIQAVQECERLARMNPGERFFVLKATVGMVAQSPKVERLELIEDEVPF